MGMYERRNGVESATFNIYNDCVGKVLIPVFLLTFFRFPGRAQELCLLLDTYWDRMNLKAPIYFSAGLTVSALSIFFNLIFIFCMESTLRVLYLYVYLTVSTLSIFLFDIHFFAWKSTLCVIYVYLLLSAGLTVRTMSIFLFGIYFLLGKAHYARPILIFLCITTSLRG